MNVSYQWLSQYIDLSGYSAADLAEKLTRAGIEVDVVAARNAGVSGVVVGHVVTREKHPNADKLSVCTVDVGNPERLQIVCGAANVAAGQKVPVAVVGAVLPGDFKIKRAKLRDVESHGMICSAKELGLNEKLLAKDQQEGILVLPADAPLGEPIVTYLGLDDEVLELDLTPNRSDCLSMLGAAYEIGAILDRPVTVPETTGELMALSGSTKAAEHVSVHISSPEHCSLYSARIIEGVRIAPSPQWLKNRLLAAGIRPINNVVDVTNFVMLEYGQPLHAFDRDRLANGAIDVRLAHAGETLVTLDDQTRALQTSMLVIADGPKAVALAGVMGGASSEVTAETSRILLESAKFAGPTVRKTSRQLGLRSESSLRFEKEVNADGVFAALDRAAVLIAQLAGGTIAEGVVSARTEAAPNVQIGLTLEKINSYLGTHLHAAEIEQLFARLQFGCEWHAEHALFHVHVPNRRGDITRDVDLIEEIARIYGYDRIPTSLIHGATTVGALTAEQQVRRATRVALTGAGLDEVINYSFTEPKKLSLLPGPNATKQAVALALPMSEERSVLRKSLLPHMLDVALHNRNHGQADVFIFELGHVFATAETALTRLPDETLHLGILMTGNRVPGEWMQTARAVDFYDLKGTLEALFAYLGLADVQFVADAADGFHPGRCARLAITRNGVETVLGWAGQVHPAVQQTLDLPDTYVAELQMAALSEWVTFDVNYKPLPRFPESKRDLALVVGRDVATVQMIDNIRQVGGELLQSVQVFDVYTGDKIASDKKSVAFALLFRHDERTLQDEEVQGLTERIVRALNESFGAQLRT
jgi:phenylalanyl-tRNA synthetase beta chain